MDLPWEWISQSHVSSRRQKEAERRVRPTRSDSPSESDDCNQLNHLRRAMTYLACLHFLQSSTVEKASSSPLNLSTSSDLVPPKERN